MQQWTYRLGLSLMVLVGMWTNRLPAQEIFVVPTTPYAPAHHPYSPPAYAQPIAPPPAKNLITRTLNQHGIGCGVDPFYPNCGNLRYEAYFVFGSCRWFMAESCPPGGWCGQKVGIR